MAGPTINDNVPAIDQVIGNITHGFCLASCTVAFFTFSFLLLTPGDFDYKDTVLNQVVMAVPTTDCIA